MQLLWYIAQSKKKKANKKAAPSITSSSRSPPVLSVHQSLCTALPRATLPSNPTRLLPHLRRFLRKFSPSDPPTHKIHARPAATAPCFSPCTCGIRTVIGEWRRGYKKLHTCAKIAGACCWQAAQEPHCGGSCLLPSAKGSRHHGIYLSSNSVTVDFSTKQRFHCPAS